MKVRTLMTPDLMIKTGLTLRKAADISYIVRSKAN